ncbi:MAG: hypothetical protein A4E71_01889 [Smithella sp. PtaU1.Bin162]|nr:MAG: hypothetical protein A4E71_01889 [Smithella sp. PtaU1.Bin162]
MQPAPVLQWIVKSATAIKLRCSKILTGGTMNETPHNILEYSIGGRP